MDELRFAVVGKISTYVLICFDLREVWLARRVFRSEPILEQPSVSSRSFFNYKEAARHCARTLETGRIWQWQMYVTVTTFFLGLRTPRPLWIGFVDMHGCLAPQRAIITMFTVHEVGLMCMYTYLCTCTFRLPCPVETLYSFREKTIRLTPWYLPRMYVHPRSERKSPKIVAYIVVIV